MSLTDSIIAQVGYPTPYSSVLRVPVKGPFNTLAIVHMGGAGLLPGIVVNSGKLVRTTLRFPSNFILAGFDQRVTPIFEHSTAGFVTYIGSSDDATFTYAIDGISTAGFDEQGRYYVDYDAAMLNITEYTSGACSISSWVLVNEPPVGSNSQGLVTSRIDRVNLRSSAFAFKLSTEGLQDREQEVSQTSEGTGQTMLCA